MQHYITTSLLLLIFLSVLVVLSILYKMNFKRKKNEPVYKFSSSVIKKEIKSVDKSKFRLDPHELKLLAALVDQSNSQSFLVSELNELFKLEKLSKENQRQRRHIILKELNLKLFLVTGIRECIIRVPSETDKRIKFYTLHEQILENDLIRTIVKEYA
ncbi:MAG: hypothetical protein RIQ61_1451 [Bacteroidota bacterium]